ncbi:unnamed protein product [Timema podura]|uniref:Uncharacterized protein n=1 Tax=Timema podura TaxID=61482 RepID=A0ABN7P5K9_TIMPD|nr:unnamed protein product [Timema podura]
MELYTRHGRGYFPCTAAAALTAPHWTSPVSWSCLERTQITCFVVLALFAIFALVFAQESAPKESLKGSEAVYLASLLRLRWLRWLRCLPLRRLRCWL